MSRLSFLVRYGHQFNDALNFTDGNASCIDQRVNWFYLTVKLRTENSIFSFKNNGPALVSILFCLFIFSGLTEIKLVRVVYVLDIVLFGHSGVVL